MKHLRIGCVGTGFIAARHLQVLSRFPEVDVAAVADAVPERAAAVAAEYGGRAYGDGMVLLGAEDLDAVWLCVPPFAHGPLEHAAVDRGLPFFVEKPIALDLAVATAIADRVTDAGLLTAVGYHWRHLDVVTEAARLMAARPPGLVMGYWLDKTPPVPWWPVRAESGGQVLEQTTHVFDLARLLVGEVATVQAAERTAERVQFAGADVPTSSAALLRFESGAIGSVSSSCVLDARHRVGLHLVAEAMSVELLERSLADHELRVTAGGSERVEVTDQDPIEGEDREFVDALLGRVEEVRVPYAEALRTQALVWAVDRSARQGTPVDLAQATAHG